MKENNDRPEGWGSRGPKPKQLKESTIWGLEVGRGETRAIIPPDQVYELVELGLTNKEIANFFGTTDASIARNFAVEIAKGREMTKIKLRRAMMENACVRFQPAVQIFLAKAMLGMSETGSSGATVLPWIEGDDTDDIEIETEVDNHTEDDIN